MKPRKAVLNILLVGMSAAFGLLLCEAGSRLLLDPADYLAVELVEDQILGKHYPQEHVGMTNGGFVIDGYPPRLTSWRLRFAHVGNTAKRDESWPYVLGLLTGKSVYNLAMGGYGPTSIIISSHQSPETEAASNHMWSLRGRLLRQRLSHHVRLPYWSFLRTLPLDTVDADIWEVPDKVQLA